MDATGGPEDRIPSPNACWTDRRIRWAALALAAFKLYLVAGQPIFAITPADKDELLSVRLADRILSGEWLGAYDVLTLVKGAAYSVFMALTVVMGLPLPLAQHLLYALAAWLLVRVARRWIPGDMSALVIFALILWNPVTFDLGTMGRVLRHHLVAPMAMLVVAGLIALRARARAGPAVRLAWAATLGLAAGTLWLTREETFWIAPSIALLGAASIVAARRDGTPWRGILWPPAVAAVMAGAPVATVAGLNLSYYGWFGTVETRAAEYVGAIGALNRVIPPDGRIPLVPVNRSVRELVYEVSPTFRELKPHLEDGPIGLNASQISSLFTGLPVERMEFADGWTYLAIRDAVQAAGHASSARDALACYARMAREVNEACDSGRLPAGPRRNTLRPVWQPTYTAKALDEVIPFVSRFATGLWNNFTAPASIGNVEGLRLFRDLTQWHASAIEDHPELTMRQTLRWGGIRGSLLAWIGKAVAGFGASAMALGVLAWLAGPILDVRRRQWPGYLWWTGMALWGGAAAVVAVAFYMHVTSFPILNPGYYSAAYPLAYAAAGFSVAALWRSLENVRRRDRA